MCRLSIWMTARHGACHTVTGLAQHMRYPMRQVAPDRTVFPVCELSIRLLLRQHGLRLERAGFFFKIFAGHQLLLDRDQGGRALNLHDIDAFARKALCR
jgi:hypothetical protein